MRPTRLLVFVLVTTAALGGSHAADDKADLLVIVNHDNAARPTASDLEGLFLKRTSAWGDGERVVVLNAPPDSSRRQAFDRVVLGMTPEEVARYWLDQRIRGRATAPREVADPRLAVKLVSKLHGAVAYVPAGSELDGTRVIARIRNDKVVLP